MKKVISMNYGNSATQAAENHGDEWASPDTFYEGYIHQVPTRTHSQNSLAAAEAPSLKMSSHGTSLNWNLLSKLRYQTNIP